MNKNTRALVALKAAYTKYMSNKTEDNLHELLEVVSKGVYFLLEEQIKEKIS